MQLAQGYECICDQNFWNGTRCNESVDICANSQCSPEGTRHCAFHNDSHECICINGWEGELCDKQAGNKCLCPKIGNKTRTGRCEPTKPFLKSGLDDDNENVMMSTFVLNR